MKLKKIIINAFVFIFFVSITFYIVFKNNDIIEIFQIIMNVDKKFILIAIICMLNFIFSEGINIYIKIVKLQNKY